jgi:hypothetical protein
MKMLKGELTEACRAGEVAEEKLCSLYDASTDGARRLVVSEMERREQFKEFFVLRAQGVELWLAIVGLSWVRNHLLEMMRAAAIRHIEMAGELDALRAHVCRVVRLLPYKIILFQISVTPSNMGDACSLLSFRRSVISLRSYEI